MATRTEHAARPGRESLSKRLGRVARQIKERDGNRCVYCSATMASELRAGRHMHLDHLDTHVTGGADVASNLVLACHRCNSIMMTKGEAQLDDAAATSEAAALDRDGRHEEARLVPGSERDRASDDCDGSAGAPFEGRGTYPTEESAREAADAMEASDEVPLCGAPATTTRTIEDLVMPLCEEHAAEIDREQSES